MFRVNKKDTKTTPRCFGVFVVNSEHISHLCSSVSTVNFEHVMAGWVPSPFLKRSVLKVL